MVAAAPKEGALRPAVAVALLASFLGGLALLCFLASGVALYRTTPLEKSPEVMRVRRGRSLRDSAMPSRPPTTPPG